MTLELSGSYSRPASVPMYQPGEVAKFVGVQTRRLRNWRVHAYVSPPPRQRFAYLEVVEMAVVSMCANLHISLAKVFRTREFARQVLGHRYPFATLWWHSTGGDLNVRLEDVLPGAPTGYLVAASNRGQQQWEELAGRMDAVFEYEEDLAMRWYIRGRDRGVFIDPRVRFGAPNISGVETWVLRCRRETGESISYIAEDFGLCQEEVRFALEFEGLAV